MATLAESTGKPVSSGFAEVVDRWIYVFMAALFFVTVLVGFIPDSIAKIGAVQAGQRPPFPTVLHVHAVLMGCWLSLLMAQTALMATGRTAYHRQLGLASMVLAPAMVVTGILLVPTMYLTVWGALQAGLPPQAEAALKETFAFQTNIALFQIRAAFVFSLMVGLGVAARGKDAGLHKRLMILATATPLPAAFDRIGWLPSSLPASPTTIDLYLLLWISPMFLWDLYRLRRIHPAYLIWIGANLPFAIAAHALWGSKWWFETFQRIMGVA